MRPRITFQADRKTIVLSKNEIAYIRYCLKDLRIADICEKMDLSMGSINHLREGLLAKLKVRSTTGIVLWSLQKGLMSIKDIHLTPPKKKKRR